MNLNYTDLRIAHFIQEKNGASLDSLHRKFHKSTSTLRRSINAINVFLPDQKRFYIEKEFVHNNLDYTDYIHFISSISPTEYIPSAEERIDLICISAFFHLSVNLTTLYHTLELSTSTKKQDSRLLREILAGHSSLMLKILPRHGVTITGREEFFRLKTVLRLSAISEINSDHTFSARLANTPIENTLFHIFMTTASEEIKWAQPFLDNFLLEKQLRISYPCKKFIYIYLAISAYRKQHGFIIDSPSNLQLLVHDYALLPNTYENQFLNYLLASLDYSQQSPLYADPQLQSIVRQFIITIQNDIITTLYHPNIVFTEIYSYIYKSIIRNHFNYYFYDNKLDETKEQIANLFYIITTHISPIETAYNHKFTEMQCATLTLIFKRMINENKVIGRNNKKIVIVTNSSMEKIAFFIGNLKSYVDITLVDSLHINELHRLDTLHYDLLITFSNRISTLLIQNHFACLKLNFYLTSADIEQLLSRGFSSSRRKILSTELSKEIAHKSPEEIETYLYEKYPDYFI